MQDDFFGKIEDSQDLQQTLQVLVNVSGYVRSAPRQLKQFATRLTALKRKKIDTAEADALLQQMNSKFAEIKLLSATKPVDTEALTTAVEDGSTLMEQLMNTMDELGGNMSATDKLFEVKPQSVPSFNIPTTTAPAPMQ